MTANEFRNRLVPSRNALPEVAVRSRARMRKTNLAEGSALARRKGYPQSSALTLVQTFAALRPFRFISFRS